MHPNDFIPLAEETGMIIDIGNWVINNAFSFVRRLNGLGNYSLWVSINVSPVQFKIDKSFIDGIVGQEKEREILNSIISLAQNIGLDVVAEGVETEEQLKYLLSSNCHIIQGYLFSKPVSEDEAIKMLDKNFCIK